MSNQLTVADITVRQDEAGRFNLNDLHKAAGGADKDRPNKWARSQQFIELVAELRNGQIRPFKATKGSCGGTFVVKELVYAYAMWISPKFHLKVIRAYDQLQTGNVQPTQPQVPQSFAEALRLAADTQLKVDSAKFSV